MGDGRRHVRDVEPLQLRHLAVDHHLRLAVEDRHVLVAVVRVQRSPGADRIGAHAAGDAVLSGRRARGDQRRRHDGTTGVRRAEKGVPVTAKVWRELTQNADKLGITPPEARSPG
jgi:hypothetical protein